MHFQPSAISRMISILLLLCMCMGFFASCRESQQSIGTTILPTQGEEIGIYTSSDYVKKYGDQSSMEIWLKENITTPNTPPVTFKIDGKSYEADEPSPVNWISVLSC